MSHELRSEMVKVRVSPAEKAQMIKTAERKGMTTSEMVREIALKEADRKK